MIPCLFHTAMCPEDSAAKGGPPLLQLKSPFGIGVVSVNDKESRRSISCDHRYGPDIRS